MNFFFTAWTLMIILSNIDPKSSYEESFKFDFFSDLESAESFLRHVYVFFFFLKAQNFISRFKWHYMVLDLWLSMTEVANKLPKYYCRSRHHWLGKTVMYRTVLRDSSPAVFLPDSSYFFPCSSLSAASSSGETGSSILGLDVLLSHVPPWLSVLTLGILKSTSALCAPLYYWYASRGLL